MIEDAMSELQPGSLLDDRFRLDLKIGRGAFGTVWKAQDLQTRTIVAIKILHGDVTSQRAIDRMFAEAMILEHVDHPNVIRAFGHHFGGERTYIVMEHVDGEELKELIARTSEARALLPLGSVRKIFEGLCAGVAAVHRAGVLHRDLKPQNVLLLSDLTPKVVDFGIAKLVDTEAADATTLGRRLGSLMYMSPEQARGEELAATSDVFSLGCLLFELLTMRRTWARDEHGDPARAFDRALPALAGNTPQEISARICRGEHPQPSAFRSGLPVRLDDVVERALAVRAVDRFQSVDRLLVAFREAIALASEPTDPAPARARAPSAGSARLPIGRIAISHTGVRLHGGQIDPTAIVAHAAVRKIDRAAPVVALSLSGLFLAAVLVRPLPAPPPSPPPPAPELEARPRPVASERPVEPVERKRPRRAVPERRQKPAPAPEVAPTPLLEQKLAELEKNPRNSTLALEVRDRIVEEAAHIPDATMRDRIIRTARSSALLGDVRGLRQSLRAMRDAITN